MAAKKQRALAARQSRSGFISMKRKMNKIRQGTRYVLTTLGKY